MRHVSGQRSRAVDGGFANAQPLPHGLDLHTSAARFQRNGQGDGRRQDLLLQQPAVFLSLHQPKGGVQLEESQKQSAHVPVGLNGQSVAVLHPAGSVDPSVSQGERAILGAPGPGQGAEGRELLRLRRIVSAPDDQGRKQEQEADQEPSRPLQSRFHAHGLCLPCLRFF